MPLDYASNALIEPTTDARSVSFTLSHAEVPARLSANGLAPAEGETEAETIPVSSVDGPDEIATPVVQGGTALALSADDTVLVLTAPGPYLLEKGETAGDVGVYLAKG